LLVVAGLVGYVIVRTGNAPASWKHPFEQAIRDGLERWLMIRPRFKEFAVGHPLMLLGLAQLRSRRDTGRAWIWLGMMGQVSIINTFCHLHSPLVLAIGRSLSGAILGWFIGCVLARGSQWMTESTLA